MDMQGEFLHFQLVDQIVDLTFQGIGKQDGRFDFPLSETNGTVFIGSDIHGRTYPLARDLHQSEFAQRKDVVFGPVFLHVLAHALVKFLPVFCQVHIDEVHHNDSAHISQPELACQLISCAQVYVECICLLSVGRFGTVSTVYVHHVECFSMFDNQVSSAFIGNGLSERGLDLFGDTEIIEIGSWPV